MEDKILVNLNADHTFECAVDIIGREGEGGTTQLQLTIPEKLIGCSVYLDFEKPNGETLRTPKLKIENGKAVYDVVQYLLTDDGEIKAQAILITGDGKIWKSTKKKYLIQKSINALEEIPEKEDFFVVTTKLLELAESARRSVWIKYSANADGSNFTDEWSDGQKYIGFATANECPTKKNDFEWVLLPKGDNGDGGVGITDIRLTERREYDDIYTITLTNGNTHTFDVPHGRDGTNGKTPVKGVDYFTEADKSAMVISVMEAIGTPLFGLVDDNNNVILSGKLGDGSYNIKYEMADGSTVPIGELLLDTAVYHIVANTLTNCTTTNNTPKAVEGKPYTATISANSGYELKSVKVTMGGTDITSSAVSGGNISILSVTGKIVITAVAEEKASGIINQIPISTDANDNLFVGTNGEKGYKTDTRISGSSGGESSATGVEATGFIPIKFGDTMYLKGIVDDGTHVVCFYNSARAKIVSWGWSTVGYTLDGSTLAVTIGAGNVAGSGLENTAFVRLSANEITDSSIITINQPLE